MNKYNKKLNKNKREAYLRSQSKLKKDFEHLTYFDYIDLFIPEEEVLEEKKRRANLMLISSQLIDITDKEGDINE